jgi:hypothetical protein
MSAPTKPQQDGELPKLKTLWPTLHESVQEYWREQFLSQRSQADLRKELLAKLKINLRWDNQLTKFRGWLEQQDVCNAKAERMQENESRLRKEHPDWSLSQIREEVLRQSYFETLASGDFKLGLKTVTGELKANAQAEDRQRYLDAKRSDEEKALSLCLEDANAYPEVQELFKTAFAAFKKAKAAKK